METNNTFEYTYSAPRQEEIKKIREKYLPREEDKMEQLRRLDDSVTQKASVAALVVGILGALILGGGMSLAMVWERFVIGIAVGILGIVVLSFAYPLYSRILKTEREKIAPEILRLTDELMK